MKAFVAPEVGETVYYMSSDENERGALGDPMGEFKFNSSCPVFWREGAVWTLLMISRQT